MEGKEVGDDRIDISNAFEPAALGLVVQESVLGMRTSKEDTGITNDLWNFCEVSSGVPSSKYTMYNYARKTDNFKNLEFVDSPPLRTIIDTTKVDRIHSTSYVGKCSILGAKRRSSNVVSSSYLSVANLVQDGCLAVWKGPDPKYLPSTLGGCHCSDSYNDPFNTYLFMKAFRGGGYDRLYGTAVEEAREAIRLNESGTPTPCIIAEVLRDNDTYNFATFANFVAVPDPDAIREGEHDLPMPLYERSGVRNEVTATESRLVQAKRLLPKAQALVEFDKSRRIERYIFGATDIVEDQRCLKEASFRRRSQISLALHGNSAFVNLLNRKGSMGDITALFRQGWKPCVNGQPEFRLEHAVWLNKGAKGETLSLFDIPSTSDMYVRSEVSMEESLKVGGIPLVVPGGSGWIPQTTVAKVGLYEITTTMEEWCDAKMASLISLRNEKRRPLLRYEILPIFSKYKEWINDDTNLIEQCIEDTKDLGRETQVVLISNDKRQANQMCRQANVTVVLVDPKCLPGVYPGKTWNSTTQIFLFELEDAYPRNLKVSKMLRVPSFVYYDSGAVQGELAKLTIVENEGSPRMVYSHELDSCGINPQGKRYDKVIRKPVYTSSKLQLKIFNPEWKDPFKKSRKAFGRDTASLTTSWERGQVLRFTPRVTRRKGGRGMSILSSPS
jgi:hypothetical protein